MINSRLPRCWFLFRLAFAVALALLVSVPGSAQSQAQAAPARVPLKLGSPVQDKNFYLLSLLERDAGVRKTLAQEPTLKQLRERKIAALAQTFEKSKLADAASITELSFTDEEITQGERALSGLYKSDAAFRRWIEEPLRQSGMYEKYRAESSEILVAKAWRDCAAGINNIISVYGLGKEGRSPAIDSISYDAKSFLYGALLHNIVGAVQEDPAAQELFFQPSLKFSLALLDANRRDEAGRFEPMEQGENKAAFQRIRATDWKKYPYSAILIPGYGPEEQGVQLSPIAKLILSLAVRRYREGKAPFFLVSGGYVHPKQTPYCEAYEMKQSLMRDFGVPENAILIDPHARHTTTNLRNAARILYRYGVPFEKPILITTNTFQSADIEGEAFRKRCQSVFGYQPHQVLKRLSPFDLEVLLTRDCLYADPMDPLDP